jgi:hypothetical protein
MKTVARLLLAGLLLLQLPVTVAALQTSTMRGRDGFLSINDSIPEVLKKCGPPAFEDRRVDTTSYNQRYGRSYETVTVDTWTYNFGSQEFMYEVTFKNGRVAKIDSLETGYEQR